MFCPQCGVQAEQQTKFCKSCGLKLADHVQLIAASREAETERMSPADAQRQLRWLKGTRTLALSPVLTPLLMLFVGIAASSHGSDAEIAGGIAFFLSCVWLGINVAGFSICCAVVFSKHTKNGEFVLKRRCSRSLCLSPEKVSAFLRKQIAFHPGSNRQASPSPPPANCAK